MTDSTPPSIPPRKRPTTPTTAGRQTTSSRRAPGSGRDVERQRRRRDARAEPERLQRVDRVHGARERDRRRRSTPTPRRPTSAAARRRRRSGRTRPDGRRTRPPRHLHRIVTLPSPATSDEPRAAVPDDGGGGHRHRLAQEGRRRHVRRVRCGHPTPSRGAVHDHHPGRPRGRPDARTDRPTGARPSTGRIPTVGSHGAPRRVRLAISRVDPWSVMKLSFLLSVAIGIMIVVAAAVVWFTLNGLHVFTKVDDLVTQITGTGERDRHPAVRRVPADHLRRDADRGHRRLPAHGARDHRRVPLQHRGGARRRRARDHDRRVTVRPPVWVAAPALG